MTVRMGICGLSMWHRCLSAGKGFMPVECTGHCSTGAEADTAAGTVLNVRWRRMQGALKHASHGERIFRSLYGQSRGTDTFWLDRCSAEAPITQQSQASSSLRGMP